jgi:hypothetical protein
MAAGRIKTSQIKAAESCNRAQRRFPVWGEFAGRTD